jgi:aminoglycoside phosphotransferase family enzyme/predicted kinase
MHPPETASDQSAVLAWLATPAHYPHPVAQVERIDTHSASVFLAGDRAYKLKRAVRFSFLDFSTLEQRRLACEAEVRINRRSAPAMYLGVIAVTAAADGTFALRTAPDPGTAVEWLVEMRRFPAERLLDQLAIAGRLSPSLAAQLADIVFEYHAAAMPTPHRGTAADLGDVIDDNGRALAAAPDILDAAACTRLTEASGAALARHRELIEARRAGGFVRQCHGDLHLRNIVLLDEGPTLFDAIEFNDTFTCIDVWYDAAFLLMDLAARGLDTLANVVFNQYLLRTGDLGGLPMLPLLLATRAAIRAKTSLASLASDAAGGRSNELVARTRSYLALAQRFLEPTVPRLIAIGGRSGSGKSTVAAQLAPRIGAAPGAVILRSDVLRKLLLHRDVGERLGAEGYTEAVTRDVYRAIEMRAADLLALGWSVIVDATFLDPASRTGIAAVAARAGVAFDGIWLEATPDAMADRVRHRTHDASDATEEVLRQQLDRDIGAIEWQVVPAGITAAAVSASVDAALQQHRLPQDA